MQQLISHLLIICDNVYKENAFAVYDPNLFQFCTILHRTACPPPLPPLLSLSRPPMQIWYIYVP